MPRACHPTPAGIKALSARLESLLPDRSLHRVLGCVRAGGELDKRHCGDRSLRGEQRAVDPRQIEHDRRVDDAGLRHRGYVETLVKDLVHVRAERCGVDRRQLSGGSQQLGLGDEPGNDAYA